jgi:hypothetical protein
MLATLSPHVWCVLWLLANEKIRVDCVESCLSPYIGSGERSWEARYIDVLTKQIKLTAHSDKLRETLCSLESIVESALLFIFIFF